MINTTGCSQSGLPRFVAALVFATSLIFSANAQEADAAPTTPEPAVQSEKPLGSVTALREVQRGLDALNQRIATVTEQRAATKDEAEAKRLEESLAQLELRATELRRDLETIATGLNPEELKKAEQVETTWSEDLREVVSPALDAMRDLTEDSRETQELRERIAVLKEQRSRAERAVTNLRTNIQSVTDEELREQLKEYLRDWEVRLTESDSQLKVAEYQLKEKTDNAPSIFDAASSGLASFFRNRGLNLLVAAIVLIAIIFGGRYAHRMIVRYGPMHKKDRLRSFGTRLFDLSWSVGTALLAVIGLLVTFYLFDDWVLLSISIIFLFGLAWAGKETLPQFFEQGKLLLNLGPVRESERIVYEGVPWKVGRLGFYTDLTNPALDSAVIRLSANDLLGMHSRPLNSIEPWFPTEEDDWVIIGGEHGKVVKQTPEYVRVLQLGGARITYPASDFIAAAPVNLSYNFRINVVFGIDYMHQKISTTKVPTIFENHILKGLCELLDQEQVISVKAEFASANASSLDYEIIADFSGKAASKYRKINRAIQRLCVEVCNEHGWNIPFTQITVHQADAAAAAENDEPPSKPHLP